MSDEMLFQAGKNASDKKKIYIYTSRFWYDVLFNYSPSLLNIFEYFDPTSLIGARQTRVLKCI